MNEELTEQLTKPKNGILKEIAVMLIFFTCYSTCYVWVAAREQGVTYISMDDTQFNRSSNDNIVNINDTKAVTNFLTSKRFRNENMSIKFQPGGYYELIKDYDVALKGSWRTGEKKYDSSVMLYLSSQSGTLLLMLSSDGKIIDKSSLRIFQ